MDLTAVLREKLGKSVKALRKEGLIPAELYGHGLQNTHLSVSAKDFSKVFKEAGTNTLVTLRVLDQQKPALIYEVVRDALTNEVAHVDFYQVKMDEKIKAKIPLEFIGEAPAVKEKGAVLNKSIAEIEVEALPKDLPRHFVVDLVVLNDVDKSIYVRDLSIPHGVKVLIEDDMAIVTATPPVVEEEKVEAPTDVSAVKVETEEKKAERQTEKGEKEKGDKPDTK